MRIKLPCSQSKSFGSIFYVILISMKVIWFSYVQKVRKHPTPIWSVKALSSPDFVLTSPIFCQIEVEHHNLSAKDQNLLHTYLG